MSNFRTLENAQNIEVISNIFANNNPISQLKSDNPYCIILVGSPGVGKTTQASKYIKNLGLDYNNFYHVSLDSLVEKVKPYRNTTYRLYSTIKSKKNIDKNIGILNSVYLPTILSHKSNFSLKATEKSRMNKIKGGSKKRKVSSLNNVSYELKSLNELRKEGFIYGVMNQLNIIYDTTLNTSKDKISVDIMPIIEMSPVKYTIKVILVTAPKEVIKKRLNERHSAMISQQYIRAINPQRVDKFISENETGFEFSKKYIKEGNYEKNTETPYTADDFEFKIIDNSKSIS